MGIIQEFREFLNEYKVIPLAIAFIMGAAVTTLVQSLVNDVIMPIITPFIPAGGWQTATFNIGPIAIKWGSFVSALINFLIIALVVFAMAKLVLKEEKVTKK
ncbi:MAG: MscL family protein [Candidatus Micrarchaeia archaeon]